MSSLACLRADAPDRFENPLAFYRPTPGAYKIKRAIEAPETREVFVTGANQASKTVSVLRILAAWATGYEADWVPRKPERWGDGPLQIFVVVPEKEQAATDFCPKFEACLPPSQIAHRFRAGGQGTLVTSNGSSVRLIPWQSKGAEGARRTTQGGTIHVAFVTEECPPAVYDELIPRCSVYGGLIITACVMGLDNRPNAHTLDTDWFRERAQSGVACDSPQCQHSETTRSIRHVNIEYTFDQVRLWSTRRRFEQYIASLPENSRDLRLGRTPWSRLPTGRAWPSFRRETHVRRLSLAEILATVPVDKIRCLLTVDEGWSDDVCALLELYAEMDCPRCAGSLRPGWIRCSCDGRVRQCPFCGTYRGWQACPTCEARGYSPKRWTVGAYQSREGENRTQHNADGIRAMLTDFGVQESQVDTWIIDNMLPKPGNVEGAKAFVRSEGDALHMCLPGLPKWTRACKTVSRPTAYRRGNNLLFAGDWLFDDRATPAIKAVEGWTHDSKHDGHHGLSHGVACLVYGTNEIMGDGPMRMRVV